MTATAIRPNKAAETLPDEIKVSELHKYHGRQLRNIVVSYQIGEPKWRNTAQKDKLIEKLTEHFPSGVIQVPKAGEIMPGKKMVKTKVAETAATVKAEPPLPGLLLPKSDETFVFSTNTRAYVSALGRMAKNGEDVMNTLLAGPQGCGKTSVAYEFAARMNMPLLKMNCPMVREPRDWFGAKMAAEGRVYWEKALFAEGVARGNVVVLLDEITRATPQVLNTLLPLLDWTRETYVEEAKELLKVGPNTFFFATANIGAQFTGTFKLDSALADRFGAIVECSFLPEVDEAGLLVKRSGISEDVAKRMVKVATLVRADNQNTGRLTETVSTRTLLELARLYSAMQEKAFHFTVLPKFSADGGKQSERAQVVGFIQGQFPGFTLN